MLHFIVTVVEFKSEKMGELKQEKDQVSSDFKITNVYSLSDLTSSDAGVSGECNNEVKTECETKDFQDCSIELMDNIFLQENIKQELQCENVSIPSHTPQPFYTAYSDQSSSFKGLL